jgi:hypothetical protein
VLPNSFVLARHNGPNVRRQILRKRFLISLSGDILATLALGQNGGFVHLGDRRFDVDPSVMQRAGVSKAF